MDRRVRIAHHRGFGAETLQNGNGCDEANDDFYFHSVLYFFRYPGFKK